MSVASARRPHESVSVLWPPARVLPRLAAGDVHVWTFPLDVPPLRRVLLEPLLSRDEHERARRFKFARDRERYIVGRAVLRCILAGYRHDDPRALTFEYGRHGKPVLASVHRRSAPYFNLAHCEGLALCAVTEEAEVGVDLERVVDLPDAELVAREYFSASEREALEALPPDQRAAAFFNCWTRKEAYLKATSEGLSAPLDRFDVTLAPGEPARILRIKGSARDAALWTLHSLEPAAGFVGALAMAAPVRRVRHAWWT